MKKNKIIIAIIEIILLGYVAYLFYVATRNLESPNLVVYLTEMVRNLILPTILFIIVKIFKLGKEINNE